MRAEPALRADEEKARLLRSLEAALRPSNATPGSVESEIDYLVELSGETVGGQDILEGDRKYAELALRGFAAVPELLKHVSDDRLTRAFVGGSNRMAIPRHLRVGELVSAIIGNIAGDDLDRGWIGRRSEFSPKRMAEAEKWWTAASKQSEEAYFVAHILPAQVNEQPRLPLRLMLITIAKRYPARLAEVFRQIATAAAQPHPHQSYPWLAVVAYEDVPSFVTTSALPADKKIELLLWGSEHAVEPIAGASKHELARFKQDDVARIRAAAPSSR